MNIEVDYKPDDPIHKEKIAIEDELGDLIDVKPNIAIEDDIGDMIDDKPEELELKLDPETGVDENKVFRENLEGIRCILMDETNYNPKKGALEMIQLIFNECVQYNRTQEGCILIGIKRNEGCYLHFRINPGKPSFLTLKNST